MHLGVERATGRRDELGEAGHWDSARGSLPPHPLLPSCPELSGFPAPRCHHDALPHRRPQRSQPAIDRDLWNLHPNILFLLPMASVRCFGHVTESGLTQVATEQNPQQPPATEGCGPGATLAFLTEQWTSNTPGWAWLGSPLLLG